MKTSDRVWLGWVAAGVLFIVGLVGSAGLAGCGGDDGGATASCGKAEPCGGPVVGTWAVASSCINAEGFMPMLTASFGTICPAAKILEAELTASGSFSFTAAMTYTAKLSTMASLEVDVPASCLAGFTCTIFNSFVQLQLLQNPVPGIQSFTCAGTTACTCTLVPTPTVLDETGTYSNIGSRLTTLSAGAGGGVAATRDYCVQGNLLHLLTLDRTTNMGPMGGPTITTDIVATKK